MHRGERPVAGERHRHLGPAVAGRRVRCFMRTESDTLVMGSFLLHKTQQPETTEDDEWRRIRVEERAPGTKP